MNQYEESKTVRRVAAVIYLIVMAFIVGGSYIAQQNKQSKIEQAKEDVQIVYDKPLLTYDERPKQTKTQTNLE